ncbi:uncharacterized protein LOC120575335 [Perca fluviatilis]|uniref:uncharacterized protein LOC120575335 n=1 Tax=Perca fluviatilis TaxID=8168 RepID=UPI0019659E00|nr:uncharacterized protein LOC120575335 [Perca fluviatilis]
MATANKTRSAYFTPLELEILMQAYSEYEHVFRKKSNTAAVAKERETAWEKIAAQVNACKPVGEKRSWKQLKMKYKNIVQTANRKKAEARRTGGGPAPPPLIEAEELAWSRNEGRPVAEGIPGGSSSSEPATSQDISAFIRCNRLIFIFFYAYLYFRDIIPPFMGLLFIPTDCDGVLTLVDPHVTAEVLEAEETDEEDTLSAATERDPERPTENMAGQQEEGPSPSTAQMNTLPVKDLYKAADTPTRRPTVDRKASRDDQFTTMAEGSSEDDMAEGDFEELVRESDARGYLYEPHYSEEQLRMMEEQEAAGAAAVAEERDLPGGHQTEISSS